jgi:hypothetical protein
MTTFSWKRRAFGALRAIPSLGAVLFIALLSFSLATGSVRFDELFTAVNIACVMAFAGTIVIWKHDFEHEPGRRRAFPKPTVFQRLMLACFYVGLGIVGFGVAIYDDERDSMRSFKAVVIGTAVLCSAFLLHESTSNNNGVETQ